MESNLPGRVWIACDLQHWDPACPARLSLPFYVQLPYPPDSPYISVSLVSSPPLLEAIRLHARLQKLTERREAALTCAPRSTPVTPGRPTPVERGLLAALAEHAGRMRRLRELEDEVIGFESHVYWILHETQYAWILKCIP
jgi:hypothetical protein